MQTLGIDLAAEPKGTAIAVLDWSGAQPVLAQVRTGVSDDEIVERALAVDFAALDAPLGWPDPMVEYLLRHRDGPAEAPVGLNGLQWRRSVTRRTTDLHVAVTTGVTPLAVGADRIAAVALRAAGLQARLAAAGRPVDRCGSWLVEVYPAAALAVWGLPNKTYKRAQNLAGLGQLVDRLHEAVPALHLGEHEALCRRSDDALDAVLCAVLARAAGLGKTGAPDATGQQTARREGWIHLPTSPLTDLLTS